MAEEILKKIAIYGAGGFGREVVWLIESSTDVENRYEIVGFIDDNTDLHGKVFNDIPVMSLESLKTDCSEARIVGAIGPPKVRERVVEKAAASGFPFETIIHPRAEYSRWIVIGEGTVICAGTILTTNILIGKHVQINLDCTIGHNVILADYTTLAPGVHVSGYVYFGKRVYVGTGAVIINGTEEHPIEIGDDVVIGAGAVVTKSVAPGLTVVGVPAKPIQGYR